MTHHKFDVEDVSITEMDDHSDSDDDCVYGDNKEKLYLYHKVSGQNRGDGLKLPVVIAWVDAMATLVEEGGWIKNWIKQKTQNFGYCPCGRSKEKWCRQKDLWHVQGIRTLWINIHININVVQKIETQGLQNFLTKLS